MQLFLQLNLLIFRILTLFNGFYNLLIIKCIASQKLQLYIMFRIIKLSISETGCHHRCFPGSKMGFPTFSPSEPDMIVSTLTAHASSTGELT